MTIAVRGRRAASRLTGTAVAALALTLAAGGCSLTQNAAVTKVHAPGFLGSAAPLLTPGDVSKGQAGLRYWNPNVPWSQYGKVIIEPVTFWGDDASKVSASDQTALTTYFYGALQTQFGQKFTVVTAPGPGVMRLQVAVTDAESATPVLRTVSLVVPQLNVLETVQSLATGEYIFAGSLQAAMKLSDAATGQLLAAAVGRALGGGSVAAAAQWKWGDAENAMDTFATKAAANLAAVTSGRATPDQLPVQ